MEDNYFHIAAKICNTVEEGDLLYENLVTASLNGVKILLHFDKHSIITPTYLNCSVGRFIDVYGEEELKKTLHIKGSERNINFFKQYIKDYLEIKGISNG